jgi:hypothetical protein
MIEFFQAGGWSMIPVLLFGVLALGAAGRSVARPNERWVGIVRALSAATVFAIMSGLAANIAAVGSHVPANPEWAESPRVHLIVMQGIAESMAPAVMGFTLLSLAWLVAAASVRRLGAEA